MEDLLKEAFEAGKDLGHSMRTGKPAYGLHFKEWYEGKALRIHAVVGQSEQLLDFIQWRKQVSVDELTDKEIVEFYLVRKVK